MLKTRAVPPARTEIAKSVPAARRGRPPATSPWRDAAARDADRERKRAALIRAAAQAFKANGFHNTSLDDVAAAVGVTKPLVYFYVGNKQQLLFECFRTGVDELRVAFKNAERSSGNARQRLIQVLAGYAEAITGEFGWCMVRAEDLDLDTELSSKIKSLKSEIDQGLRRLLRAGMEDGSVRDCDPKMTAFAVAGALNWIAYWHRGREALTPGEIAARFVDLFDNGLAPRVTRPRRRLGKAAATPGV
jgi:AcrR family transcriptional regulator